MNNLCYSKEGKLAFDCSLFIFISLGYLYGPIDDKYVRQDRM